MNRLNHSILVAIITFALSGLQGFHSAEAAGPMSPEGLQYFKKFEGKWGGASWSITGKTKGGKVEVVIGEIDSAKGQAKVTYSLSGGAKSEDSQTVYAGSCEKDKIFFESSNNRIEFILKGDKLWGTRSGKNPGTIVLNKLE